MNRHLLFPILLMALASAGWLSGCGDGTGSDSTAPDPPRASSVTIRPPATELTAVGATVQLTAEVRDQNGQVMAGAAVEWASGSPAVATVEASGLVTAAGNGTATITAAAGSASGSATVTVAQQVNMVEVSPAVDTLLSGDTVRLAAAARDANGHAVAGAEFSWSSSDTAVAVVDATGLVTGVGGGEAEVTAIASGVTGTARIVVLVPVPTTVTVTPDSVKLAVPGDTARLAAEVLDQIGRPLVDARVQWSSSDATVATVDSTGLVTATGNGTATITATSGGAQGTAEVSVFNPDRAALEALYRSTDGPNWVNGDNWLTDAPLGEWYGVSTDSAGRVAHVFLAGQQAYGRWSGNGLAGPLPPELGDLSALVVLILAGNDLTGPLPPELGNLSKLEFLGLDDNSLTGPLPPELGGLKSLLQLWLQGNNLTGSVPVELASLSALQILALHNNELTGSVPAELGSLSALKALRLDGNGLTGSIPPELGNLSNLERLDLDNNDLTGPVPSELGGLADLQGLFLGGNELSGPIPAELGSLSALQILWLDRNNLTGPIPSELGKLSNLSSLYLDRNSLTGPIPSDLGGLAALEWLDLGDNELTGPIPAEIGGLGALRFLWLDGNQLTGPLPAVALGRLANLAELLLDNNRFTGPVPSEIGGLSSLRHLSLAHNADMAGPVPVELAALTGLAKLVASGTGLCVPSDPGLLAWLEGVPFRRIAPCEESDPPMAYLTQAVQSREFPVPLIAGEEALLRVFPTAERATAETIPAVRAHFYVNGGPATVVDIPPGSAAIPVSMDESDLTKSANAVIPGDLVRPGLEMVVQIDPDGTTDPGLGVRRRIPRTGRLQVDVQAVPLLDLTLIPFVFETHPDSSLVELVEEVAADPADHAVLEYTRMLLPVGDLNVTAHQPVRTRAKRAVDLLIETAIIRIIEGRRGHYQGLMPLPLRGFDSGAYVPGRSSVTVARPRTVAMALGGNFGLGLAPCGRESADPAFPYADGSIGAWGYDRRVGRLLPPSTTALMGDCDPPFWVSDYNFANGLRFRASEFDRPTLYDQAPRTATLLLSGGIDENGMPFLEPAFVVDAPAALPQAPGDHRITGLSADGAELFSLSFDMSRTMGGDGSAFAFAVPVETSWAGTLTSITLSGPGRSVTIDADGDRAMVILRDSRTGQVRGVLRDLPGTIATPADAVNALSPAAGVEVLLSRGIPRGDAWRR